MKIRSWMKIMLAAALLIMISGMALAEGYQLEEIQKDNYKVIQDDAIVGYLAVGEAKALAIGLNANVDLTGCEQIDGKELIVVNTAQSVETEYDLGGRIIETVDLDSRDALLGIAFPKDSVELTKSVGYLDKANAIAFTVESIGNDTVYVSSADNLIMNSWGKVYFDLLGYNASVKKMKTLVGDSEKLVICDGDGNVISEARVNDMNTLVDKMIAFDTELIYTFDKTQSTANYIAEHGTAKIVLHDASYGFLGYKLINTSIEEETYGKTHYFTVEYEDGFYILKDTDVQANYLLMNDEEAFLVDCGQFAGEELWKRIEYLIGDRELSIYITHEHGDHWYNIQYFDAERIKNIYLMVNSVPTRVGENTGVYNVNEDFEVGGRFEGKRVYIPDGGKFTCAGREFMMIHMAGHSVNGSGLIDLTGRHLFSGDTLGTQSYIGGTNVKASTLDVWVDDIKHMREMVKYDDEECLIDDIFMGHLSYPISKNYIEWMDICLDYVVQNGEDAIPEIPGAAKAAFLVITENGVVLDQEHATEVYQNDVSEEDIANYASIGWRK